MDESEEGVAAKTDPFDGPFVRSELGKQWTFASALQFLRNYHAEHGRIWWTVLSAAINSLPPNSMYR